MINVGYINSTYAEKRNIIGIIPNAQYVELNDLYDWTKELLEIIQVNSSMDCFNDRINRFQRINNLRKKVDIIHTFNTVCLTKSRWVSTFETTIPRILGGYSNNIQRYNKYLVKKGIEAIKKKNCIKLIAMSQDAYDIQKKYLMDNCQDFYSILAKTQVLHPPQKMLISPDRLNEKFSDINEELRFLFIGRAFFRKGGAVICKVLSEFRKYYPIKLTIVSSLFISTEYGITISKEECQKMKKWLYDNKDWVTYYSDLSNRMALKLAEKSHIGLLPSYYETYGYTLLEMQAAGCPTISTDIRAFPEINNNICGWICKIKKDLPKVNLSYCDTMNEEVLGCEFRRVIEDLLNNIGDINQKGRYALRRIEFEHSPENYAKSLLRIYNIKGRDIV